ncbi:VOC family protein [Aurantiacibacter poecillastricola]|uniref:VOC family protein n=1 Tax=Aurantiacibacter poecillastricola TaxID=3064385 RepID=UPI0027402ED8|nr:VOC family protein [Aurantiacibacter sp. 219JJ12-13]MDP5262790.1 VOC family protein [Aurantiacibacter sp. 219JJ12-13]
MKLDHMVVMVRSLEASLPWYEAMLGLIGFAKSRDHVWVNKDGLAIDLKQAKAETPDYGRYAPGLNHLGFTAPDRAALDAVRDGMAAAGFDVPEIQQFKGETATFFRDPEGMRVEVTVYDPDPGA